LKVRLEAVHTSCQHHVVCTSMLVREPPVQVSGLRNSLDLS
jgi:hypothetical protein